MAESKQSPKSKKRSGFVAWLKQRHDPLTGLLLTIPIFLTYHLGILLIDLRNGVDLVSTLTFQVLNRSLLAYVAMTLGYAAAIALGAYVLRRKGKIRPAEWIPVVGEGAILALIMLFSVGWMTQKLFAWQAGPAPMGPLEKIVMACGAGFHEELVFRVGLFAGGAYLLERFARMRSVRAAIVAGVVSSVLFSLVHYVGPLGDRFELVSFGFRFLSGAYLAAVYRFRGFAVAVYTHTIYDLIVMFLR